MAKKRRTLSRTPRRMTKRERSRWERERRIKRNLITAFVVIGVVSVLTLIFGIVYDTVLRPNQVIARVNGDPISRSDYWDARRLQVITEWNELLNNIELYQTMGVTLTDEQIDEFRENQRNKLIELTNIHQESIRETTVQQLIEETLLLQGAGSLGLDVTDEEVDAWLMPDAESAPETSPFETQPITGTGAPPTPVSTLSPRERDQRLREHLTLIYQTLRDFVDQAAAGKLRFSREDYVRMVRHSARISLLQQKVQDYLLEDMPKTAEQVHASHILLQERRPQAEEALQTLQGGEPFPEVVVEYSDDPATRDRAGDLGWISPGDGTLPPPVEEVAFSLAEPGHFSEPVEGEQGIRILQLVEREPDRVHVRHILIPADRREVALEALRLLQVEGQPFTQVAQELSEDANTASQGGELGWIERGDGTLSTVVEEAAFDLTDPNQVSEVIEDEVGYHIVQMLERDEEGDRVHLRHILIRDGEGLAREVVKELRTGTKDFSEAVVEYSADQATVELAGDRGWVGREELSPELAEAAFALTEAGQLSGIVEDEAGYHIVQLLERDEATGQIHLREIEVKRAADLAEQIRTYIVEGDPETQSSRFLEMALEYSDDPGSKSQGGDLGWFGRGRMIPQFEEVAFSLEPGEVSEVLETEFGYHIIWVQEYDADHPLDEEMLDQQGQQAFEEWLQELKEVAVIERYPPPTATPTPPPLPTAPPIPTTILTPTVPISPTAVP